MRDKITNKIREGEMILKNVIEAVKAPTGY